VSNVVALTNLYITDNLLGVVKLMRRLTLLDSRQRRENHVLIPSSVSTAKIIIKLIQMNVPSCYELKSSGLDKRTTLVLSNTRELDREFFYKLVYLI